MNEVQVFNNPDFGEIRTVIIDGEPWFVGFDVAKALGYKRPTGALKTSVDEGDSLRKGVCDRNNHTQQMIVINESGLYALIFNSKLETAKKFKKWVTSEVLPSIRRTGSYGQPQLPQNPMELLELHYEAIKYVDSKVDRIANDFEQFKREIPLFGEDCSEINARVTEKVCECLGGKQSTAYQEKRLHRKLYRDIYTQTNRSFGVATYKAIRRNQMSAYIEAVTNYQPPIGIQSDIDNVNTQQTFNI